MYTAVVLDGDSQEKLKLFLQQNPALENFGFLFQTSRGDPLPHHMTINLGALDANLNNPSIVEQKAIITVKKIGFNEKMGVCAAVVESAYLSSTSEKITSMNDHPHITCCLKQGVQPKMSNQMLVDPSTCFFNLENIMVLSGTVKECK